MLDAILIIAAGIIAASGLIIARRPDAAKLIDKLSVASGWIGVVLFFWGAWNTLSCLLHIGTLFSGSMFLGLLILSVSVLELVLGFLLGFGLITHWTLRGNAMAMARGQAIRAKLATYQGTFGLAGIAAGAVLMVRILIG